MISHRDSNSTMSVSDRIVNDRIQRIVIAAALVATMLVTVPFLAGRPASAATSGSVDVGYQNTCVVMEDSTVQCWGFDQDGILGTLPSTDDVQLTPTTVPGVTGARQVAIGDAHVCALLTNGTVTCWGSNSDEQLGNGTGNGDPQLPASVNGLSGVTQISSSSDHTCVVTTDETVKCWGDNDLGQAGADPVDTVLGFPTTVAGLSSVTQVEVGTTHSCALTSSGEVWCWGANDRGALGDGTDTESFTPVQALVSGAASHVSTGDEGSCAVLTTGGIECWGEGEDGNLGNGTDSNTLVPGPVSGITNGFMVALGEQAACAILTDGSARCWGDNDLGQLGNGSDNRDEELTPVAVVGVGTAATIAGGEHHFCVTTTAGALMCWGDAANGELATDTPSEFVTARQVSPLTPSDVTVGNNHTCLRAAGGSVACFGENPFGQLGDGTNVQAVAPVPVSALPSAAKIDAGGSHTCARLDDGTAACWGGGGWGRLGNGATVNQNSPVAVSTISGVSDVTAGGSHSCAVVPGVPGSSASYCWGLGSSGQRGDGTNDSTATTPVVVSGLTTASAISAGSSYTCAIVSGGTVTCWGSNTNRQLGTGDTVASNVPVPTLNVSDATQISAGHSHACSRTTTGTVWCWGNDSSGALGHGNSTEPALMTGVSTAAQVEAGTGYTCVRLLPDETVQCIGDNSKGQLGNGTIAATGPLGNVVDENGDPLTGIRSIAVAEHSCAIRRVAAGGGVFCWGKNSDGELGVLPWVSTPITIPLTMTVGATTTTSTTTTTTTTVPTQPPTAAPLFTPVVPARLVDTRATPSAMTVDGEQLGEGRLDAGGSITVDIGGRALVPEDADAAVVNITAVRPGGVGFITGHPCLDPAPTTSSLNYTPGVSLGNEVIVQLDDDGNACLFTSASTDIAIDVVAYLPAGSDYTAVGPARLADTRPAPAGTTIDGDSLGDGSLAAGSNYEVQITDRAGIPASARAAVVNVTAIRSTGVGYFTAHPCLATPPNAASLNFVAGANRGNEIIAPLSPDGSICIFNSAATDLSIDIVGFIDGTSYTAIDPARLLETRSGIGLETADGLFQGDGKRTAGTTLTLDVANRIGIPNDVDTVTINLTAIQAEQIGYATVFPCLPEPPNAASLNFVPGINGGNEIIAEVDANGQICIFTSADVHLTADIAGHTT